MSALRPDPTDPICMPVDGLIRGEPMDACDTAWAARHTVYLGRCGNFDYWGNPTDPTGHVLTVGRNGCWTNSYGDRGYWRGCVHGWGRGRLGMTVTDAGMVW